MIELLNISYTLPSGLQIIDHFSARINEGDFVVLLGGNGSGKSSLIKILMGQYRPQSGSILLSGIPLENISRTQRRQKVICLTQFVKDSLFVDLTVVENARIIANAYHLPTDNLEDRLASYFDTFHPPLKNSRHKLVADLSGGEQQILAFLLYIQHQPDILLLDEHTSALDPKMAALMMEFTTTMIRDKKITALMATHNLDFAEKHGNRIIGIASGKMIFEKRHEDKINREELLAIYG
jgi:putative ABC transport system ATP-binding protein